MLLKSWIRSEKPMISVGQTNVLRENKAQSNRSNRINFTYKSNG